MRLASLLSSLLLSCAHVAAFPESEAIEVIADSGQHKHPLMGCISPCGIIAPQATDCDGLAEAELRALHAYSLHVKAFPSDKACKALRGWNVFVYPGARPDGSWRDPIVARARNVIGLAYIEYKQMFIGTDDWISSAFVHEIGHALDHELTPRIARKAEHPRWRSRGICKAIQMASTNEEDCSNYK